MAHMTRWLPLFWALAFWGASASVLLLSLLPVEQLPPQVLDWWDKAQHAMGFGWLALVGLLAYPRKPVMMCGYLLVYGGAIELAQAATGWRYGEWWDLAADGIGIMIGAGAWWAARYAARVAR